MAVLRTEQAGERKAQTAAQRSTLRVESGVTISVVSAVWWVVASME